MSDYVCLCVWDEQREELIDLEINHAAQALVQQLPNDKAPWTPAQRAAWMRAFNAVLDFAHPDSARPPEPSIEEMARAMTFPPLTDRTMAREPAPVKKEPTRDGDRVVKQEASEILEGGNYQNERDAARLIKAILTRNDKPGDIYFSPANRRIRICGPGYTPQGDEKLVGNYDKHINLNSLAADLRATF